MGLTLRIDLDIDKLTYGDLYRFADQARAAGVPEDRQVEQDWSDNQEVIALTADLGDVDSVVRPVLVDGLDAPIYAAAVLWATTQGRDGAPNDEALGRLHNLLVGLPADWRPPSGPAQD
jgi:hypothetical protein